MPRQHRSSPSRRSLAACGEDAGHDADSDAACSNIDSCADDAANYADSDTVCIKGRLVLPPRLRAKGPSFSWAHHVGAWHEQLLLWRELGRGAVHTSTLMPRRRTYTYIHMHTFKNITELSVAVADAVILL